MNRKIRRLRNVMLLDDSAAALLNGSFHTGYELFRLILRRVGRGEKQTAAPDQWQGRRSQPPIILCRLEHTAFLRPRERWRIHNDQVKQPAFLAQPPKPVKYIP